MQIELNFSGVRKVTINDCEWKDLVVMIRNMEFAQCWPEGLESASYACAKASIVHEEKSRGQGATEGEMSYTTIKAIYPGDRTEDLEELRNSHGH